MSIITMGFGLGIALGPLLAGVLAVYSILFYCIAFHCGGCTVPLGCLGCVPICSRDGQPPSRCLIKEHPPDFRQALF